MMATTSVYYMTCIICFLNIFIIQLIQMYPNNKFPAADDDYHTILAQSMNQDYHHHRYRPQQHRPIMIPNSNHRRPHIRSDVHKILVEKLSSPTSTTNEHRSQQQHHTQCNATVISSSRLLIPNECAPNGNHMETIQIYPVNNTNDKIIRRNGRTIFRLQRTKNSLVELNETIPGSNDNNRPEYRQEPQQQQYPSNAIDMINNNVNEPYYNEFGDEQLDGRQFLPPFIAPPFVAPPIISPLPIIPGFAYEYEYFEYQWCRPYAIEISICELCVWVPTVCPIIF
ncbi:hypothetical protein DERF_010164 [Dermatophagoides farinae]|uniref:Uncharacterized protein n=1 Tax=Dermatophagoides farinae TaxID=6954 RepID=A0A922HWL4_DERFA|nr:hypothetical protein DERF_010164 [Dermatophagoides farinae]